MTISPYQKRAIKKMVEKHPDEVLDALLEASFWPKALKPGAAYSRRSDDTDGLENTLTVIIGPTGTSRAGDVWVDIQSHIEEQSMSLDHCFRSGLGGGMNLRLNRAFLFVARAIQLHNQEEGKDR